MLKLYKLTQNFNALLEKLYDGDVDEVALYDTIESLECDITQKAENIAKIQTMMSGDAELIDSEIKRLTAKKKAIENRQDSLKKYLMAQLRIVGMEKIKGDLFTISIRKNPPKLVITNPALIPSEYFIVIPEKLEIDNALIKDRLKLGEFISGAELQQGESLSIK